MVTLCLFVNFGGVAATKTCLATPAFLCPGHIGTFLSSQDRLYTECPNSTHEFLGESVTQRKKEAQDAQVPTREKPMAGCWFGT